MNKKPIAIAVAVLSLISLCRFASAFEFKRGSAIMEAEQCAAGGCSASVSGEFPAVSAANDSAQKKYSASALEQVKSKPALGVASPVCDDKEQEKPAGFFSKIGSFIKKNAWPLGGAAVGAIIGGVAGGPLGALVGAVAGGVLGWLAPKLFGWVKSIFGGASGKK